MRIATIQLGPSGAFLYCDKVLTLLPFIALASNYLQRCESFDFKTKQVILTGMEWCQHPGPRLEPAGRAF